LPAPALVLVVLLLLLEVVVVVVVSAVDGRLRQLHRYLWNRTEFYLNNLQLVPIFAAIYPPFP
jgi:uncharacterized membrane-anchored protein